jgi:pyruvyltransferase
MLDVFWFRGVPNYGDILTPYILDRLQIKYRTSSKQNCNAIFIGSIANLARPGVSVFGSGFIRKNDPVCPSSNWHFVRGPLTREMVLSSGGKCPELYCDLALLLPTLIQPEKPIHPVGFCPHGVEYDLLPKGVHKIRMYHPDVVHTTKQITQCEKIISSSLHGIVVAMAYGIPAAYVSLSDRLSGDGMKFFDFYRSVGLEPVLSTIEKPVFQLPKKNIDFTEINSILERYK